MGEIIKINLKDCEKNWWNFLSKCLTESINYNEKSDKFKLLFHYECDSIEMIMAKNDYGIMHELKSVSLDEEEYLSGSASDEEIIANLINTLKCSPDM